MLEETERGEEEDVRQVCASSVLRGTVEADRIGRGTAKPMPSLFSQAESKESDSSGDEAKKMDDEENPF